MISINVSWIGLNVVKHWYKFCVYFFTFIRFFFLLFYLLTHCYCCLRLANTLKDIDRIFSSLSRYIRKKYIFDFKQSHSVIYFFFFFLLLYLSPPVYTILFQHYIAIHYPEKHTLNMYTKRGADQNFSLLLL